MGEFVGVCSKPVIEQWGVAGRAQRHVALVVGAADVAEIPELPSV